VTARPVLTPTAKRKARAASAHAARVKKVYGLDRAGYATILAHQQGVCAICEGKRPYRLHVDHDHSTGLVRGLCCARCNKRLLPAAKDDPAILRRAIDYLTAPPAVTALGVALIVPSQVQP